MGLMKALIPSTILTLIVAAMVGATGADGNFLHLEYASVSGHLFYWSWPFFMTVMAINGLLISQITKSVNA
jgi:hypothetical protein